MDSRTSKILAVMVVALFCVTAFAVFFADDDSSAAETKTYRIYVEVIDDDGSLASSMWIKFDSESTPDSFVAAANAAATAYGLTGLSFSSTQSGITVIYNTSLNNACYYAKDNAWVLINDTTTQYTNNSVIGLAVGNGYITSAVYDALTEAEKAKWKADAYMSDYYVKLLDVAPNTYPASATFHMFVEILKEDLTVESKKWISFESDKTNEAFIANANKAAADNGLSKLSFSIGKYGVNVKYDGNSNNMCNIAVAGKWTAVSKSSEDYINNTTSGFSLVYGYISAEKYNGLSDDAKKEWVQDPNMIGTNWEYKKVLSEPTNGYEPANNDGGINIGLIIGAVVVVVLVVGLGVFFFKKKGTA